MVNKDQKPDNHSSSKFWKEFLRDRFSFYTNILPLGIFVICYLLFFNKQEYTLFPDDKNISTIFFNDSIDNGNSVITGITDTDSCLAIEYILKEGFIFPYSGIQIQRKDGNYLDLSDYNCMETDLSSTSIDHLYLYFQIRDENVKDTTRDISLRRMAYDLNLKSKEKTFEASFDDFVTPDWWYNLIKQPKSDFTESGFSKVRSIVFSTGINSRVGVPYSFKIRKIRFYNDHTSYYLAFAISQLFFLAASLVLYKRKITKAYEKPVPIQVEYKAIQLKEPDSESSRQDFLKFINDHYENPDLSLKDISMEAGMSQRAISDAIAEKFGCNIKTYINNIRITESKRLLLETDLKVNEIAYKVGFNSPANFNRVFRATTGMSPSEFVDSKR